MAITVKFRRGSTSESNSFLGDEGELYIDKDKDTVVVHNGTTVGGFPLARESFVTSGLATKQDSLVSGNNVKTINGQSLLGSSDFSLVEKINITAGSIGSATAIPVITYNAQGQITAVTSAALDLSTKVDKINISAGTVGSSTKIPVITYNEQGQITSVTDSSINIQDIETRIGGTIATQGYVNTQVANLIDASPATLDTLNELAAALGDDPNFATTVSNQIGLKANTSSLATVATSGSYNDLSNKPTLVSAFTNDANYANLTYVNTQVSNLSTVYQPLNANLTTLSTNGYGVVANKIPRYDADGWLPIGANWKVRETGGVLFFAHGTTNRMKIDASGNLTVTGDITAFGTV